MRQSHIDDELDSVKQELRQTKEILQTLVQQQQSHQTPQFSGQKPQNQFLNLPDTEMRQSYAVSEYKKPSPAPLMRESHLSAQSNPTLQPP